MISKLALHMRAALTAPRSFWLPSTTVILLHVAKVVGLVLCLAVWAATGLWWMALVALTGLSLVYGLGVTAEYYRCRAFYNDVIGQLDQHIGLLETELDKQRMHRNDYRKGAA